MAVVGNIVIVLGTEEDPSGTTILGCWVEGLDVGVGAIDDSIVTDTTGG